MLKEYEAALTALDLATEALRPPSAAVVDYYRAVIYLAQQRFVAAEAAATDAAAASPKMAARAYLLAARAALEQHSLARTADHLADSIRSDEDDDLADSIDEVADALLAATVAAADEDAAHDRWVAAKRKYQLAKRIAKRFEADPEDKAEIEADLGEVNFELENFKSARTHYSAAVALAPDDGDSRVMLGRSFLKTGDPVRAKAEFESALSQALDLTTTEEVRGYLDALSPGIASQGKGLTVRLQVGPGYDTDAARGSVLGDKTARESQASALINVEATAAYRFQLGRRLVSEVAYNFEQIAYEERAVDDMSYQEHTLGVAPELSRGRWRMTFGLETGLVFAGVRTFKIFQELLATRPTLSFDESLFTSTTVGLEWLGRRAPSRDYAEFGGSREDLTLGQEFRFHPGRIRLQALLRDENLGRQLVTTDVDRDCRVACFSAPMSYHGMGLSLSGTFPFRELLDLDVSLSAESRAYDGEAPRGHVDVNDKFVVDRHVNRLRQDLRLAAEASLEYSATNWLAIVFRYDVVVNRSNIDNTEPGQSLDFDNRNFTKNVILVGLAAEW